MEEYIHISHTFSPVFDENSKILILGSFPSVKSREQGFYYGHPQNRFWKVMAAICRAEVPQNIAEKKAMLLKNRIAIWDVIDSCDIKGSSDSSIRNVVAADIAGLLKRTNITAVFANGKTAGRLYEKYVATEAGLGARVLPSTSPANAAVSLEKLIETWNTAIHEENTAIHEEIGGDKDGII